MDNGIVIIASTVDGQLTALSHELVAFARQLSGHCPGPIEGVVIGANAAKLAHQWASSCGVNVTAISVEGLDIFNGEIYGRIIGDFLEQYRPAWVGIGHTAQGLAYGPALALRLGAAHVTGVEGLTRHEGRVGLLRPLAGGRSQGLVIPTAAAVVAAIQPGAFAATLQPADQPGRVTVTALPCPGGAVQTLRSVDRPSAQSEIDTARVIVCAGNGIGESDNLALLRRLTELLPGAALAGSRIVCDRGWLAHGLQIGATGKTVSPELYIGCGVSGASQHIAGMSGSKLVVAINKDARAPITNAADVVIVEDLTRFVPALIQALEKRKRR